MAAWLLGMTVGITLTLVRMLPFRPLEWLVAGYVEYHRNVPLLVQILGLVFRRPATVASRHPHVGQYATTASFSSRWSRWASAGAAYISEDMRSGIRSIPKTQYEAARSIGFNYLAGDELR